MEVLNSEISINLKLFIPVSAYTLKCIFTLQDINLSSTILGIIYWSSLTNPFNSGITLPTALAAPVEDGMMLVPADLPPRQSLLDGPSTVFCVAVNAWIVVMRPSIIPNLSLTTLARGARQLVVQEALLWKRNQYYNSKLVIDNFGQRS